jgi:general secretion pathway protein G
MITAPEMPAAEDRSESGFTLIELMAVIAIIGILVSMAVPQYKNAITTAREAALVEDLSRMRDAIEQYYADKGKYPESLEDLVSKGYLKTLPKDPVQPSAEWVPEACTTGSSEGGGAANEETQGKICGVTSGAEGTPLNFGVQSYKDL